MEGYDNTDLRLAELRLEDDGVGEVNYPPSGTFRSGATISAWYANVQAGNRPLQELQEDQHRRGQGLLLRLALLPVLPTPIW